MILVDTSVWVDHLRHGDDRLADLLNTRQVLMHPAVLGELACGNLHNRGDLLALMQGLPKCAVATDEEVLFFIDRHSLMGRGIGYIDAQLLASVALGAAVKLWTRDKRLQTVTASLSLLFE